MTTSQRSITVTLSHAPNPDVAGGYWQGVIDSPGPHVATVADIEEARAVCREFIDSNGLGGGNWTGGTVRNADGEIVGTIAYNGRLIPAESLDGCPTMRELQDEAGRLFRSVS